MRMMTTDGYATREDLFALRGKRRYRDVELPLSGLKFRIQSLNEAEVTEHQNAVVAFKRGGKYDFNKARILDSNRRLICKCLVDADGKQILTDEDYQWLGELDNSDIGYLYEQCAELCRITGEGTVEELAKNLSTTTESDSSES
jgi:hypothetical protein